MARAAWLVAALLWLSDCDADRAPASNSEAPLADGTPHAAAVEDVAARLDTTRLDTAPLDTAPLDTARLSVAPASLSLGSPVQYDEVRRPLALSNRGVDPVSLLDVEAGHSCTVAPRTVAPRTVAPPSAAPPTASLPVSLPAGETLALELRCRPRLHGIFVDRVRLRTSAPAQEDLWVAATGQVVPAVVFDRELLEVSLPFGARKVEEVRTEGPRSGALRLRLREGDRRRWSAEGLLVDVLPAEGEQGAGLRIQLEARHVGKHAGTLLVETGLDGDPSELALPYAFHVSGTLNVAPEPLYVNLRAPQADGALLDVRSTQPGFRITQMRVLEGPFVVSWEQVDGGHVRARVRAALDHIDADVRGATGRLLILSNDRTQPRREVALFALGKIPQPAR